MENMIVPVVELSKKEESVFTTSLEVARVFGKEHRDMLRAIKNLECSEDFTERNFALSYYKDASGKRNKMVKLTRDGFVFLAMGFTGKKAAQFKEAYIKAFNAMEQELKGRLALTANYRLMSTALKETRQLIGKETKPHHYCNEADMLNRLVFGKTSAELREELGENYRDCLPAQQVQALDALERINASLIDVGMDYQERKVLLVNKAKSRLLS